MSGLGAAARTESPRPARTNGVTVPATTLPLLTRSSIGPGFPVMRSAVPSLSLCCRTASSAWMTVTLCPLARENAAASSLTPGVAPWLVRMTRSAAMAAPDAIDPNAPKMHAAAIFAQLLMASSHCAFEHKAFKYGRASISDDWRSDSVPISAISHNPWDLKNIVRSRVDDIPHQLTHRADDLIARSGAGRA